MLEFYLFFKRVFLGEEGGWGNFTLFQRRCFFKDWDMWIFLGMGISLKGCFLGGMGERSFSRWEGGIFLKNQRIILLVVWDGVLEKANGYLFFVFFSFVIWWLNEYFFSKIYIFGGGMEKFEHKNFI